jgi:hypothetical protein
VGQSQVFVESRVALTAVIPHDELVLSLHAPEVQVCLLVQVAHAPPDVPHPLELVPERHWLPEQQPLQFDQLHAEVLTQVPEEQVSPDLHATHVSPPVPQAEVEVPASQVPLEQHPLEQFVLVHVPEEQAPEEQLSPEPHFLQVDPLFPQALVSVPLLQVPEEQHPLQLVPQVHAWLLQSWLVAHLRHWIPPDPQAVFEVPATQLSPLQQPLEQLLELHLPAVMHCPWKQVSPLWQTTHGSPAAPQLALAVPPMQVSPWQQPVHEAELQAAPLSGSVIPLSLAGGPSLP